MTIAREMLRLEIIGYDEGWPQLHDPEFPLFHVALALEQMGGPVWSLKNDGYGERLRMSCAGDLPVDVELVDAINDWFDDYLDWITDDYINPQMNPDFPFAEFNARGEALTERCRAALGKPWTVEFFPAAFFARN